jgi:DNA (cytosine-5)-methyltransferase 1
MITAKSYFSGAGGMDLGLTLAGITITHSYEIDPICCQTLKNNFTHEIHQSDISKITVLDQEDADISVGTYPCTKYTQMSDLHGTRTGDTLFLDFFRHIALAQPEMYIVENVPGLKMFPVVMEALTKLPNYYVRIECPVNANMWGPQERKRLIVIGTKKPFLNLEYPEKNTSIRLKDLLEKDPDINIPDYVYTRLNGGYRDKPIISDAMNNDIAPCCMAHYSKDVSTSLVKDLSGKIRPYTFREFARIQAFPDWFNFAGSTNQIYKQIGNAVHIGMANWIGTQALKYFS